MHTFIFETPISNGENCIFDFMNMKQSYSMCYASNFNISCKWINNYLICWFMDWFIQQICVMSTSYVIDFILGGASDGWRLNNQY